MFCSLIDTYMYERIRKPATNVVLPTREVYMAFYFLLFYYFLFYINMNFNLESYKINERIKKLPMLIIVICCYNQLFVQE